jgi:hypothetical protein
MRLEGWNFGQVQSRTHDVVPARAAHVIVHGASCGGVGWVGGERGGVGT